MNTPMRSLSCLLGSLLLIGCGAATVPAVRVAAAEAAIRSARESGATNTPGAALHLHYAELAQVEAARLARAGDGAPAAMQYRRAEADANLALALGREAEAQRNIQGANDALRTTQNAPR